MIKLRRQGGGTSSSSAAQAPSSLSYGEPAVASDGTLYVGDGSGGVASKVKNAYDAENGLWEFYATYKMDEWTEADGGGYEQTKPVQSKYGNVAMVSTARLGSAQTEQTSNLSTNNTKLEALGIINAGHAVPGEGTVTITVEEIPDCDIDVHWYVKIM